jgi:hypothetical protein
MIQLLDDAIDLPGHYRDAALARAFRTYEFPQATFHGIATVDIGRGVPALIARRFAGAVPTLSFFRKSPFGQEEPHFIHTDVDMGEWSAILYLNPDPPDGDGTNFWTHQATGAIESAVAHERSQEGQTPEGWDRREHVAAKFNRLLLFPSTYFHSRAMYSNWGEGNDARLTQVTFGRGDIFL